MIKKIGITIFIFLINIFMIKNSIAANTINTEAVKESLYVVLSNEATFVGQDVIISIIVTAKKLDSKPLFPKIKDANIHFIDSTVTQNNGGKVFMFRYSCTPLKPGSLIIPPIKLVVDKKNLISKEKKLKVLNLMKTNKQSLKIEISSNKVYTGEPFTLKFIWRSNIPWGNIKAVDIFIPLLSNKAFKTRDKKPDPNSMAQKIGLPVNNTRVISETWESNSEGETNYFLSFEKVVVPQMAGIFDINFARLICSAEKPKLNNIRAKGRWNKYPEYFNNDFFLNVSDTMRWNRYIVKAAPVKLKVIPLPKKGRPADFNGIIGKFDLNVTAEPVKVKVGTPITLKLIVSNHPYVGLIDLPPLKQQPTFAHNFMIPEERSAGLVKNNTKLFIQSVRPTSDKVKFIPSIRIPYFDPDTGEYNYTISKPIPIQVNPNESFTEFDLDFADGSTIKNVVEKNDVGIRHNYINIELGRSEDEYISIYSNLFFILFLTIPIGIFLLIKIISCYRKRLLNNSVEIISKNAYRSFKKKLLNTDIDIDIAIRTYFAEKFNLKLNSITFADMERVANGDKKLLQPIKEFYDYFDQTNFAKHTDRNIKNCVSCKKIKSAIKKINKTVKPILTIILILNITTLLAVDNNQALLSKAESLFNNAHDTIGKDLIEGERMYKKAAMKFRMLAKTESSSSAKAALLYNAGNSYYFANDYGMSLYSYLCAEQYTPYDNNLQQNISFLRKQRIDKFEKSELTILKEDILFWHYKLSSKTRLIIFYVCYIILWIIVIIPGKNIAVTRSLLITLSIICTLLVTSIIIHRFTGSGLRGVITSEAIVARKGDNYVYEPAFKEPLHSGTEFSCLEQRGDWSLISLDNGEQCWVPSETIKLVKR